MSSRIAASVVIGSVSSGDEIDPLLDALADQAGDVPFEIIVADRRHDGTAQRIRAEHPGVQVIEAPLGTTLPELRETAFRHASGRHIFVTGDHTIPPRNWIERFVTALDAAPVRVAAVGGCVENALGDGAVDWASFFCEYGGHLPPQRPGEVDDLPGMNIAYRREVLERAGSEALRRGFWEVTLHPRLLEEGHSLVRLPDVVMAHRKHGGFLRFVSQRFHYSRQFAGLRFDPSERTRRLLHGVGCLVLPAVVLWRTTRRVWQQRPYRRRLLRSLPALACFAVVWAAGELLGYLGGPGTSLAEVE